MDTYAIYAKRSVTRYISIAENAQTVAQAILSDVAMKHRGDGQARGDATTGQARLCRGLAVSCYRVVVDLNTGGGIRQERI